MPGAASPPSTSTATQSNYAGAAPISNPRHGVCCKQGHLPTGQYSGQLDIVIGGDFTGVNGKYNVNLAYLKLDGSLELVDLAP